MTTDEKYWSSYDGLQLAKHTILKRYLGGWFPKLTSAYDRVLYVDCHAGRGRHNTGQEGSPILGLEDLYIPIPSGNSIYFTCPANTFISINLEA